MKSRDTKFLARYRMRYCAKKSLIKPIHERVIK
uniref:Uncharacterized protein n=1 Tax=Arundo donax TaxID=35708 RepID=A0A0A9A1U6_ARUDO